MRVSKFNQLGRAAPMALVLASILLAMALLLLGVVRPQILVGGASAAGLILGFVSILVVPDLAVVMGTSTQIERTKTVAYCTSCHAMEKYGKSLTIDDPRYLPAAHYQNGRVPRETACFSCHTTYTMYGDVHAKLRGLRHLWAQYLGAVPDKLHLYEPYQNRECLHCHEGTRGYLEVEEHKKQGFDELRLTQPSCLSADCHPKTHAVDELDKLKLWTGPAKEGQ